MYWSCENNRPCSGLYVYFHCLTLLFRPITTPMRLLSFIEHSYVVPQDPICVLIQDSRLFNVYWSCENNRQYSGLNVYFHCLTLFRPRTTPIMLLSFIEHSYVIPWDPICVLMQGSRHLNVFWRCDTIRPYSGLDVYFHTLTLFRPRSTPMTLLSFIEPY